MTLDFPDHLRRSAQNAFAALALDRLPQRRNDAAWLAARFDDPAACYVVMWRGQHLIAPGDPPGDPPHPALLPPESVAPFRAAADPPILLGARGDRVYFALELPEIAPQSAPQSAPDPLLEWGRWQPLRRVAPLLARGDGGLLAYAQALCTWQRENRFCGVCGSPTAPTAAGHIRRCQNPACAREHYPRIAPAVIMLVTHGERCLLGRQAQWDAGRYSTLAGFVEPGESLEEAVVREVAEETGVPVAAVTYYASQPWPFPGQLMLGFHGRAAATEITLGDGELEAARWFSRAEMIAGLQAGSLRLSPPFAISYRLIAAWFDTGDCGPLSAYTGEAP